MSFYKLMFYVSWCMISFSGKLKISFLLLSLENGDEDNNYYLSIENLNKLKPVLIGTC